LQNLYVLKKEYTKINDAIKCKTFYKFVTEMENKNITTFFEKFDLYDQNIILFYLFNSINENNFGTIINFFKNLDLNYLKNNFLEELLLNRVDILNIIVKYDNQITNELIFSIDNFNEEQINNLNQLLFAQ
jgi:hypothetical protein